MDVFNIRLKVFLLKDVDLKKVQTEITTYIDAVMCKDEKWKAYHNDRGYKAYSFGGFYPIERDKVYKAEKIYTITIRTINQELLKYFMKNLANNNTSTIKGLVVKVNKINRGIIESAYSATTIITKFKDAAYWQDKYTFEEFTERLRINLIKKYKYFTKKEIENEEEILVWNQIAKTNKKVIASPYKNIKLLGDKVEMKFANDAISQEIAYMMLGVGLAELNSRGYGFMEWHYLKGVD